MRGLKRAVVVVGGLLATSAHAAFVDDFADASNLRRLSMSDGTRYSVSNGQLALWSVNRSWGQVSWSRGGLDSISGGSSSTGHMFSLAQGDAEYILQIGNIQSSATDNTLELCASFYRADGSFYGAPSLTNYPISGSQVYGGDSVDIRAFAIQQGNYTQEMPAYWVLIANMVPGASYANDGSPVMTFDSFAAVPEPASLGIIGLGMAALLHRHRKVNV